MLFLMTEARYYSPTEASQALGVSAATLRRWSELFAKSLSPEAAPEESGARRRYTADDLAVFRYAQKLLKAKHQIGEVAELLKVAKSEDLAPQVPEKPAAEPPQSAESATESTSGQDMPQDRATGQERPAEPSMALVPIMQNVQAALTATLQRAASQERLIADQAERLTASERQIADQRERLAEQEKALEAAERQLTDLAERLAALEEHKPEKPAPWYQRIFGTGS